MGSLEDEGPSLCRAGGSPVSPRPVPMASPPHRPELFCYQVDHIIFSVRSMKMVLNVGDLFKRDIPKMCIYKEHKIPS